jgi:hypothetical protein
VRTFRLGIFELFFALLVLNTGLLALMSAFQSGSFRMNHDGGRPTPAQVSAKTPALGPSFTLRALERTG